jgi:hypothetical protein
LISQELFQKSIENTVDETKVKGTAEEEVKMFDEEEMAVAEELIAFMRMVSFVN